MTLFRSGAAMAAALLATTAAWAAQSDGDGPAGKPGDAAQATRTIEVVMHDIYYEPDSISVAAGETVLFLIRNEGQLVHEFNIGTPDMHHEHMPEMQMMVDHGVLHADRIDHDMAETMSAQMGHDMHHHFANSALLEPGQSAELAWTFPKAGDVVIEFACTVPGHYDAGMVGPFQMDAGQ